MSKSENQSFEMAKNFNDSKLELISSSEKTSEKKIHNLSESELTGTIGTKHPCM